MRDVKIKKYLKKMNYSYSFGLYPTIELLINKPSKVIKVLLSPKLRNSKEIEKIKYLCTKNKIKYEVNYRLIDKISKKENTYAVGIFKKYTSVLELEKDHIVLVNPKDMGNLGTIIRTMLGFNIDNLALIKPAADIFDPKVVRSSMGSLFSINFEYFKSFEQYSEIHDNNDYYAFMLNGEKELSKTKFNSPYSLIFGNEGQGLPDSYKDIGNSVFIKHNNNIDSLNLSIAVGIALYNS